MMHEDTPHFGLRYLSFWKTIKITRHRHGSPVHFTGQAKLALLLTSMNYLHCVEIRVSGRARLLVGSLSPINSNPMLKLGYLIIAQKRWILRLEM